MMMLSMGGSLPPPSTVEACCSWLFLSVHEYRYAEMVSAVSESFAEYANHLVVIESSGFA
jgi:hypothetical protein